MVTPANAYNYANAVSRAGLTSGYSAGTPYVEQDKVARIAAVTEGIAGATTSLVNLYDTIRYRPRPITADTAATVPNVPGSWFNFGQAGPGSWSSAMPVLLIGGGLIAAFLLLRD